MFRAHSMSPLTREREVPALRYRFHHIDPEQVMRVITTPWDNSIANSAARQQPNAGSKPSGLSARSIATDG